MSDKPENPPAFPCFTMRDYFASNSGISFADAVKAEPDKKETYEAVFRRLAKMRFAYADIMLEMRQS